MPGPFFLQANNVSFGSYSRLALKLADDGTHDQLTVHGALDLSGTTDLIELDIDAGTPAGTYTLIATDAGIDGVFDAVSGLPTGAALSYSDKALRITVGGGIVQETWTGISGALISSIPVNTPPNATATLSSFEIPVNVMDNYGVRVRGYFIPPTSGDYTFWISSDDSGELWLSDGMNTANRTRIAYVSGWTASREWNKMSSQQSAAIPLVAGKAYYIEALMKENTGSDNLAVACRCDNTTTPTTGDGTYIIGGSQLAPYAFEPEATLITLADAFVRDGTPDTNYGTNSTMMIKLDTGGYTRWGYLKFDIGALAEPLASCRLRLNAVSSGTSSTTVAVYGCPSTNWIESGTGGITWNTRPAITNSALYAVTVPASVTSNTWFDLDVTDYVQEQMNAGNTAVTLVLQGTVSGSAAYVHFASKEFGVNAPELLASYLPDALGEASATSSFSIYAVEAIPSEEFVWTASTSGSALALTFKTSGGTNNSPSLAELALSSTTIGVIVSETLVGEMFVVPGILVTTEPDANGDVSGTVTIDPAILEQYDSLFIHGIRTED